VGRGITGWLAEHKRCIHNQHEIRLILAFSSAPKSKWLAWRAMERAKGILKHDLQLSEEEPHSVALAVLQIDYADEFVAAQHGHGQKGLQSGLRAIR
jgi:hypothetical protein